MIQQISYYISKAGIISAAGKIEDERRRLSEMPTPAAFVSYAPSLPAMVGWYGYRVAFNGVGRVQLEAALDSLRRHFRLRDLRVGYDRFNGFYIMEALFAVRMNLPGGVFGGAQPAPEPDALNFYMPNGGTISLNKTGSPTVVELEYSIDGGATWTVWSEDGSGNRTLTLTAGQRMYVRNTSETQTGFSTSGSDYYMFGFTSTVYASGNNNSLLCKYTDTITTLSNSCYRRLYRNCSSLISIEGLILPTTTLAVGCYQDMFLNCTSLTLPDDFNLPATMIAEDCYRGMFFNCTSLTLPDGFTLPATTLASACYREMFWNCTSLTLPDGFHLPATTLTVYCYQNMFRNCTSLTLPDGFTLPATTLANGCYREMFRGCSLLNKIRTLMTDISATNCILNWMLDVAAQGDFYCPAELTIPEGASGIPSGWTRHDI